MNSKERRACCRTPHQCGFNTFYKSKFYKEPLLDNGVTSGIDFLFRITSKALIHEEDNMINSLNDPHVDSKDIDLQDTRAKASYIASNALMIKDGVP